MITQGELDELVNLAESLCEGDRGRLQAWMVEKTKELRASQLKGKKCKARIWIGTPKGGHRLESVPAVEVGGLFFVHHGLPTEKGGAPDKCYVVSHKPSGGLAVAKGIGKQKVAVHLATELLKIGGIDWNAKKPHKGATGDAMRVIGELVRSVHSYDPYVTVEEAKNRLRIGAGKED